jgi:hypothetical protein
MRGVLEIAQSRQADLKTRLTACMELLDRDPQANFVRAVDRGRSGAFGYNSGDPYANSSHLTGKVLDATIVNSDAISTAEAPQLKQTSSAASGSAPSFPEAKESEGEVKQPSIGMAKPSPDNTKVHPSPSDYDLEPEALEHLEFIN